MRRLMLTLLAAMAAAMGWAEASCVSPLGGPKDGEDTCRDCCIWAAVGECDSNSKWMRAYCQKSCGTFGCKARQSEDCVVKVDEVCKELGDAFVRSGAKVTRLVNRRIAKPRRTNRKNQRPRQPIRRQQIPRSRHTFPRRVLGKIPPVKRKSPWLPDQPLPDDLEAYGGYGDLDGDLDGDLYGGDPTGGDYGGDGGDYGGYGDGDDLGPIDPIDLNGLDDLLTTAAPDIPPPPSEATEAPATEPTPPPKPTDSPTPLGRPLGEGDDYPPDAAYPDPVDGAGPPPDILDLGGTTVSFPSFAPTDGPAVDGYDKAPAPAPPAPTEAPPARTTVAGAVPSGYQAGTKAPETDVAPLVDQGPAAPAQASSGYGGESPAPVPGGTEEPAPVDPTDAPAVTVDYAGPDYGEYGSVGVQGIEGETDAAGPDFGTVPPLPPAEPSPSGTTPENQALELLGELGSPSPDYGPLPPIPTKEPSPSEPATEKTTEKLENRALELLGWDREPLAPVETPDVGPSPPDETGPAAPDGDYEPEYYGSTTAGPSDGLTDVDGVTDAAYQNYGGATTQGPAGEGAPEAPEAPTDGSQPSGYGGGGDKAAWGGGHSAGALAPVHKGKGSVIINLIVQTADLATANGDLILQRAAHAVENMVGHGDKSQTKTVNIYVGGHGPEEGAAPAASVSSHAAPAPAPAQPYARRNRRRRSRRRRLGKAGRLTKRSRRSRARLSRRRSAKARRSTHRRTAARHAWSART